MSLQRQPKSGICGEVESSQTRILVGFKRQSNKGTHGFKRQPNKEIRGVQEAAKQGDLWGSKGSQHRLSVRGSKTSQSTIPWPADEGNTLS